MSDLDSDACTGGATYTHTNAGLFEEAFGLRDDHEDEQAEGHQNQTVPAGSDNQHDGPMIGGSADYSLCPAAVAGLRAARVDGRMTADAQRDVRLFLQSAHDGDAFRAPFRWVGLADTQASYNQVCLEAEYLLNQAGNEMFPADVRRQNQFQVIRQPHVSDPNTVFCMMTMYSRNLRERYPTGVAIMVTNNRDGTVTCMPCTVHQVIEWTNGRSRVTGHRHTAIGDGFTVNIR